MAVDINDIKLMAYISIGLSAIAILLACVGVGTPAWQVTYSDAPNNTSPLININLYYTCYLSNSTCTNYGYSSESYLHLRQASGLAIVGILFLFFGALGTLKVALRASDDLSTMKDVRHRDFHIFIGPLCLLIAAIIMLAALAEGSRSIIYNGYSANLYQTAHVLLLFALLTSAYASGKQAFFLHNSSIK